MAGLLLSIHVSAMAHSSFVFRSLLSVTVFMLLVAAKVAAGGAHAAERPGESAALSSGRASYQQFCAACHGLNGKGGGPVASLLLEAPADVTQISRRRNGAFPQADLEALLLARSRASLPQAMPRHMILFGPIFLSMDSDPAFARAQVAELLTFIESMQEE